MRYTGILPLVIVLATSSAIGQVNYTRPSSIDPANCPVGLQVMHAGNAPISIAADGGAPPADRYQQLRVIVTNLRLIMTNPLSREIVNAEITIHGLSRKGRFIPLAGGADAPDLAKTVHVALNVKGNGQASRDLSLQDFTPTVTSIDLNSIKYADGSEWHAAAPGACRVTPDLMMLVATQ